MSVRLKIKPISLIILISGLLTSPSASAIYKRIFKTSTKALVEVLNILLYIAEADGEVSKPEIKMIREIGFIFNLTDIEINSLFESRKSSEKLNPYIVLGVKLNS